MGDHSTSSSTSLADLPHDELVVYGRELGLSINPASPRGELLRLIRERQELLVEMDRDAMLDAIVWARVPVRRSASKEQLAKHVAAISRARFDGLSDRGLRALALLNGVKVGRNEPRAAIERRLRRREGLWARTQRTRRRLVGSLLTKVLEGSSEQGDYQFLPENDSGVSLRESIEDAGVVGGLAHKIRGAADSYLQEKLDEIERRIDRKLDEIDGRLAEWRDQEIRNRLRIVKITLITAIIVAGVSLGYNYLKARSEIAGESVLSVVGAADADTPE